MKRVDVVYAIIQNHLGEILMVENEGKSWSLPGGAVEAIETLEMALVREVYEETGLWIEAKGIAAINEAFFKESGNHAIFFTFNAAVKEGNAHILNPEEITNIQWLKGEKANELMPYHVNGVEKLIGQSIPYTYQN
ncbi:8-oxo-dGTP diphosphatase [Virgibacillus natechei]|uniref:8-oxo-dGTP diphosphatase n=1 Tax=Virgibacillus natechei TaxID=1216297 RepID=A0ABS4IGQ4_9BACI|nr:NUDIX hydrolase [Virgibacillus natechei]MBP1969770.1 8-oxo-dGTP diphosphatase [Virgibacillus natechei]UZD12687.1 NUDIX hydrolase [Virgibacillus natechei]